MAQVVKNLIAMQEIQVQSLGQEDPLEKGMATHSSILAWRIPRTEESGGLQSVGLQSQTRLDDSQDTKTRQRAWFGIQQVSKWRCLDLVAVFRFQAPIGVAAPGV